MNVIIPKFTLFLLPIPHPLKIFYSWCLEWLYFTLLFPFLDSLRFKHRTHSFTHSISFPTPPTHPSDFKVKTRFTKTQQIVYMSTIRFIRAYIKSLLFRLVLFVLIVITHTTNGLGPCLSWDPWHISLFSYLSHSSPTVIFILSFYLTLPFCS